jgi:hypothetical protein
LIPRDRERYASVGGRGRRHGLSVHDEIGKERISQITQSDSSPPLVVTSAAWFAV